MPLSAREPAHPTPTLPMFHQLTLPVPVLARAARLHLVRVLTLVPRFQWRSPRCSPPSPLAFLVLVLLGPSSTPPEPAPEIRILLVEPKASETGSHEAEL